MIPIPALLDVGSKLLDRFMPDPAKAAEAKAELEKMAQDGRIAEMNIDLQAYQTEQNNLTERLKADMGSDSWLSKNIRPLTLIFILGAYKESKKVPEINEDRAEDAAAMLFKQTGSQFVAIFKVNQMFGTRVLYRAYTKEGREKSVEGIDVGLFSQNPSNNADLIKLMENETPCSDYKEPQSEIGLWYMAQGVTFTCRTSVPPDSFKFFGQITVGWKDRPDNVEQTKTMMGIAASMLTRKGP